MLHELLFALYFFFASFFVIATYRPRFGRVINYYPLNYFKLAHLRKILTKKKSNTMYQIIRFLINIQCSKMTFQTVNN